jgi:hypothetical protein
VQTIAHFATQLIQWEIKRCWLRKLPWHSCFDEQDIELIKNGLLVKDYDHGGLGVPRWPARLTQFGVCSSTGRLEVTIPPRNHEYVSVVLGALINAGTQQQETNQNDNRSVSRVLHLSA